MAVPTRRGDRIYGAPSGPDRIRYSIFIDGSIDRLIERIAKHDFCTKGSVANRALREYAEARIIEIEAKEREGANGDGLEGASQ